MPLPTQFIPAPTGERISYCLQTSPKANKTIVYCPGLLSSMHGRKGESLQQAAQALGCNYAALEYRGHGSSDGYYLDYSLQDWIDDVVHVLDVATPGAAHVLVGSSIGAWLALHAALARPEAVQGLLLVAPAVDISSHWESICLAHGAPTEGGQLPVEQQQQQQQEEGGGGSLGPGLVTIPSNYLEGGGMSLRTAFIQGANRRHLLLQGSGRARLAGLQRAVHILYAPQDDAVPEELPLRLFRELKASGGCPYLELEAVADGDHRLSRDEDLERMTRALRVLCSSIQRAGAG